MASEDQQPAPSGSKQKLIIIVAAVLMLVIGIGAGVFVGLQAGEDDPAEDAEVAAGEAAEEEATPAERFYIKLDPEFVINFRDKHDRPKFLKADLSVATGDADMEEKISLHMPAIRNSLVLLFSRQIYDDLVPHEGKESLRQQALAEVQSVLDKNIGQPGVDDLYFSNFVMH